MDERETLAAEVKRAFRMIADDADKPVIVQPAAPIAAKSDDATGSISFTPALWRAVLSGRKTVTRRPIRPKPVRVSDGQPFGEDGSIIPPLSEAGERLWVREKWARAGDGFVYAADEPATRARWISSRYMPRAAARYFLNVNRIEIARLNAIEDAEANREGAAADPSATMFGPRAWFIAAWDAIYGDGEFASTNDPWVWAIEFTLEPLTS